MHSIEKVLQLEARPKGPDSLYDFFAGGPGDPSAGYYLEVDEDTDPALAAGSPCPVTGSSLMI